MSASSVTVKESDDKETIIESIVWGINQNSKIFAFLSPENMLITKTAVEGFVSDILVYNNYAYVANGEHGIKSFILRNKIPQLQYTITAEYQGRTGYINRLCRHENFLFANNYNTGLFLYQIYRNGKPVFFNQLFENFSPVILDIAIWGTKLLIHTLNCKLYEYPISECISSLNLSEPELLMDDVKRFVINRDLLYYSDSADNWQIKSLTGASVAGKVNTYHKSIHEEKSFGAYSLIYNIQYDTSYNRRIFISMKTDPKKYYPLVYSPKDVRSFVIQDDIIYTANGFDGIAVLPCVIDAFETNVYNQNTMISRFSHNLQLSTSYQLVFFDSTLKEFYRYENIDLFFSQILGLGIGFKTLQNDCLDVVCSKFGGNVTIQIDTNEELSCELGLHYDNPESPHICPCEVKPNTDDYQLCQTENICTHKKYKCTDLRSDTNYQIKTQTRDGMTVYYDNFKVSSFDDDVFTYKINPDYSFGPQSKEKINLVKGWNAFSFTVIPDPKSMSLLINETSGIFCYINQTYNVIKRVTDTIIPGAGYFIKLSQKNDISLTLTGEVIDNYSLILKPGWNLIGPVNRYNDTIGIDYDLFGNKHWFNAGKYAPISKSLWEQNKAYFIKVSKECTITVPKEK